MELRSLILDPIGIIRTPFTDRVDAPRQPDHEGGGASGKIILEAGKVRIQAGVPIKVAPKDSVLDGCQVSTLP